MSTHTPSPRTSRVRRIGALTVFALVAALAVPIAAAPAASAAEVKTTVTHTQTTTVQGTPNLTYYSCPSGLRWDRYSAVSWAPAGCALEIVFTGHTLELYGNTRNGHGQGAVFVDGVRIGTVNYGAATNSTVRRLFAHEGLTDGTHTLRIEVVGNGVDHASALFTAGQPNLVDPLQWLYTALQDRVAEDYTAASWPAFADARAAAATLVADRSGTAAQREAARAALQGAADALVMIRGLRDLVDDYGTRVPAQSTPESWAPFAAARTAAEGVLADAEATAAEVVAAKNGVQDAAAALVTTSQGEFLPITNNTFWRDTDGNPIYSQGGGIFRFGDTYYWYGVNYRGAALYAQNPTRLFNNDVVFVSIPVYSSKDLVNWTFENEVAEASTPLHIPESIGTGFAQMSTLADAAWLGRMGVAYNENTGKYVLLIQIGQDKFPDPEGGAGVLFLQGDSPTDDFSFGNIQRRIQNSPTVSTGDQTIFTDDDGTDYLVFSNSSGRARAFVSRLAPSDSLSLEPGVQIGYSAAGREGNAMFKLDDRYYMAASALHGWNTSPNYVIASQTGDIQGTYGAEFVLPGSERDYSHVTQTGFFVTVEGTEKSTVLYAGDRWADFAWNGHGYNQWLPIDDAGDGIRMHSVSNWELNAVTGQWRVGPDNNYVLNPEFAADRIILPALTGWENRVDADSAAASLVSNVSPGAAGSRFALRLGAAQAFSGGVSQTVEVPDGVYRFALTSSTTGGFDQARAVVTGAAGERYEIDLDRTTAGWESSELTDIGLTGGTATVTLEARGPGGRFISIDSLSLVRQNVVTTALAAAVQDAEPLDEAAHSAETWAPFAAALADARDVLASPVSPQGRVDAATAALTSAASALAPAVTALSLEVSKTVYAVGEQFDAGSARVVATYADGTRAPLPNDRAPLSGFSTSTPGRITLTATADEGLAAVGADPVTASAALTVAEGWSTSTAYAASAEVAWQGALWRASWWTRAQQPGDPYGPWQELRVAADGVAVWTASRVFLAGESVTHDGARYTAKWWTRNQAPGDPSGPWAPQG